MLLSDNPKGRLVLSDSALERLEEAVRASVKARRGRLYNALRALNAFAVVENAKCVVPDGYGSQDLIRLVGRALQEQMEKELYDQLSFRNCLMLSRWRFRDPQGVINVLNVMIPAFALEIQGCNESNALALKPRDFSWSMFNGPTGSVYDLHCFANATLWHAYWAFGHGSYYSGVSLRAAELRNLLRA